MQIHLGAMNFGRRTPEPEARRIITQALDRGVTWIDTANAYNNGESERVVGRALKEVPKEQRPKVATKVGFGRIDGRPEGLSKTRILASFDESLERLQAEDVALFYLHTPDDSVPIEESLDALAELYEAKKFENWGVSNYASWQILDMLPKATACGLPPPSFSQVIYNLLIRQIEVEYLRFARKFSIPTIVYNPLAGGLLTDRYDKDGATEATHRFKKNPLYQRRFLSKTFLLAAEELRALAKAESMTLTALAYAWIAGRPGVDAVLLGPGTVAHLDEGLRALETELSPECRASADSIVTAYAGTDAVYARS